MKGDYYNTEETVKEYIRLSDGIDGRQLIEKLEQHLAPNSSVLEFGSGPGKDWEILNVNHKAMGSDLSDEFLGYLKNKYPQGNFIELDAIAIKTDLTFGAIYSNKVLHHLKDEELIQSVKRQSEVLSDGGIICHSFWKGEGSEIFKGLFVNYHDEASLRSRFDECFEILSIETYQEFDADDSIVLIARKR